MNFTENRGWTGRGARGIGLAFLLFLPAILRDPSYVSMTVSCGIASIVAMSWLMILRIGHLSLGQAAFLAVGAYSSAVAVVRFGLSPWAGLLLGGLMTALFALGIGYVVLRIRGIYFAITTFAFAEAIRLGISNSAFLGGVEGISGIPELPAIAIPGLFTVAFDSPAQNYYVVLVIAGLAAFAFRRIDQSSVGRTFLAIARNETLSRSLGVNVLKFKLWSFVSACFFAGLAGAFSAHYYRCLDPGSYTVLASVMVQIQATVGGAGSILAGGILGASLMTVIDHFLISIDPRLITLSSGLIILVVIFFLPQGVISLPGIIRRGGAKFLGRP